jgi:hypothetical protein
VTTTTPADGAGAIGAAAPARNATDRFTVAGVGVALYTPGVGAFGAGTLCDAWITAGWPVVRTTGATVDTGPRTDTKLEAPGRSAQAVNKSRSSRAIPTWTRCRRVSISLGHDRMFSTLLIIGRPRAQVKDPEGSSHTCNVAR